jgi:hypothetical protein
MGLTPISMIRDVSTVSSPEADRDVAMPLGLDRSNRTDDDTYSETGEKSDRGMEDEDEEAEPDETGPVAETSSTSDPDKAVDFFA